MRARAAVRRAGRADRVMGERSAAGSWRRRRASTDGQRARLNQGAAMGEESAVMGEESAVADDVLSTRSIIMEEWIDIGR